MVRSVMPSHSFTLGGYRKVDAQWFWMDHRSCYRYECYYFEISTLEGWLLSHTIPKYISDKKACINWSCNVQFFSELITSQLREFHMVSPQVAFPYLSTSPCKATSFTHQRVIIIIGLLFHYRSQKA